jgi:hypothetical protein
MLSHTGQKKFDKNFKITIIYMLNKSYTEQNTTLIQILDKIAFKKIRDKIRIMY